MTLIKLAEAHNTICRYAAEIANQDPRLDKLVKPEHQPPFRAASVKSNLGGLCIEYDEALGYRRRQAWRDAMGEIGVDAIHQALLDMQDLFVGVMLGEAREGRNYFDRFTDPQGTFF